MFAETPAGLLGSAGVLFAGQWSIGCTVSDG